jgi:hypothetical protein
VSDSSSFNPDDWREKFSSSSSPSINDCRLEMVFTSSSEGCAVCLPRVLDGRFGTGRPGNLPGLERDFVSQKHVVRFLSTHDGNCEVVELLRRRKGLGSREAGGLGLVCLRRSCDGPAVLTLDLSLERKGNHAIRTSKRYTP